MSILIISLIASLVGVSIVAGEEPLTVSLYYESYCGGCKEYFQYWLYVAWNFFGTSGQVLFDLIPYGNANQSYYEGHWHFSCQHGPEECQANKLHACAAYQACGDKGTLGCAIDKLGTVMDFIYCLVRHNDQSKVAPQCAKESGLDYDGIINCANGPQGETLHNLYGNRTDAMFKSMGMGITPTIAYNGKHKRGDGNALVEEICMQIPKLCKLLPKSVAALDVKQN